MKFNGTVAIFALVLGLIPAVAARNLSATNIQIDLESIVSGLDRPVGVVHAGDGSDRLFIVSQAGRIVIFQDPQVLPTPFLDVSALIGAGGSEQGLLGLAFHQDYSSNGFFYINYTDLVGDTVISRFTVSADPNIGNPGSEIILLKIIQPFSNHNGGQLQFGPDGFLYIGMGDGGGGGDPGNRPHPRQSW